MSAQSAGIWVVVILFMLMVGTCDCGSSPSSSDISSRQVEIINTQIDTLHEEIAACKSPGGWSLLALVISVAVPLVLAVVLLLRAEKTALHNDEIIRQVARHGLMIELMDAERLLDGKTQQSLPPPHLVAVHRQRRESVDPPKTSELVDPEDSDPDQKEEVT